MLQISNLRREYTARGLPRYQVEMSHEGLKKHRIIKGDDASVVQRKAQLQAAEWAEQWSKRALATSVREDRANKKELAEARTYEAQFALEVIRNTLQHTLTVNDAIEWDTLKNNAPFAEAEPARPADPRPPQYPVIPTEPKQADKKYQPTIGLLDRVFSSRAQEKLASAAAAYQADITVWKLERGRAEKEIARLREEYARTVAAIVERHEISVADWNQRKTEYLRDQADSNAAIDRKKEQYLSGDPASILEYCDLVLSRSDYPDSFPKEFELDFNPDSRILVVDYSLPAPAAIPRLLEVKYNATRDEFQEKELSESQFNKMYDDLLYQIALRTIHEIFESDVINGIESIVFNGWVTSINHAIGQEGTACVMSVQTTCAEFLKIDLAHVDPKACFKALKGVGSSKLHSITAIAPILNVSREDRRFVSSYEVVDRIAEGDNLAAMDWEDFEHLIREIFEREFAAAGGEVRVTQASRDGGVDAVVFDPDPIRGGKIVIQAKRYTNVVGVSAVRDLFGTVMNEGATKGILVTTADYGPDAYEFAKGKPLTLLNGSNLLHLLEKHGRKARIDLPEARSLAAEQAVASSQRR